MARDNGRNSPLFKGDNWRLKALKRNYLWRERKDWLILIIYEGNFGKINGPGALICPSEYQNTASKLVTGQHEVSDDRLVSSGPTSPTRMYEYIPIYGSYEWIIWRRKNHVKSRRMGISPLFKGKNWRAKALKRSYLTRERKDWLILIMYALSESPPETNTPYLAPLFPSKGNSPSEAPPSDHRYSNNYA